MENSPAVQGVLTGTMGGLWRKNFKQIIWKIFQRNGGTAAEFLLVFEQEQLLAGPVAAGELLGSGAQESRAQPGRGSCQG